MYGVKLSVHYTRKLLHRLGFVYKKPKHVPGKADPKRQEEFVSEYRKLRANAGENEVFYFGDGCHPRQHININGLINIDTHATCVDFPETINAETTEKLFKKLISRHTPDTVVHVFLDNARYCHAKSLQEFLDGKNVRVHFLPPYSPNLNPIERLWLFFKKKVLYNRYFVEFREFVQECKNFFRRRKRYLPELRTLITENFQLLALEN